MVLPRSGKNRWTTRPISILPSTTNGGEAFRGTALPSREQNRDHGEEDKENQVYRHD